MDKLFFLSQTAVSAYEQGSLEKAKANAQEALRLLDELSVTDTQELLFLRMNMITLLQSIANRTHDTDSYSLYEADFQKLCSLLYPEDGPLYYAAHLFDTFECYLNADEVVTAQWCLEQAKQLLITKAGQDCLLIHFLYHAYLAKLLFRLEQYHACIDACLHANDARWEDDFLPANAHPFLAQFASQEDLITQLTFSNLILLGITYCKINNLEDARMILEQLEETPPENYYLRVSLELGLGLAEAYARSKQYDMVQTLCKPYLQQDLSSYPDIQASLACLSHCMEQKADFSFLPADSSCYSRDALTSVLYNQGLALVMQNHYQEALPLFAKLGSKGLSMYLCMLAQTENFSSVPALKTKADHYYYQEMQNLFLYYDEKNVFDHLSLLEYHFSLCMDSYIACHEACGEEVLSAASIYDFLINTKCISLEAAHLVRQYQTLDALRARTPHKSKEIMDSIPADTALLEYCTTRTPLEEYLCVFIMTRQSISCLRLGLVSELAPLLNFWRDCLLTGSRDADTRLRRFLFLPIKETLQNLDVSTLLIAPASLLTDFPFSCLSTSASGYLADDYEINYLNTGKELLAPHTHTFTMLPVTPCIIGNPSASNYPALPFAEQEATQIAQLLDCHAFTGSEARLTLFDSFKQTSPSLLHIAAHGIFSTGDSQISASMQQWRDAYELMEHSGLVLADNELLSCNQIAAMDLSKTGLVVLSACQSGKALFHSSEGMYGLRRSLKLAGCETIIAALWHIDDRSCSLFMNFFYQEVLEQQLPLTAAFHTAVSMLRNYKENGTCIYASPYFWAGYVLIL